MWGLIVNIIITSSSYYISLQTNQEKMLVLKYLRLSFDLIFSFLGKICFWCSRFGQHVDFIPGFQNFENRKILKKKIIIIINSIPLLHPPRPLTHASFGTLSFFRLFEPLPSIPPVLSFSHPSSCRSISLVLINFTSLYTVESHKWYKFGGVNEKWPDLIKFLLFSS